VAEELAAEAGDASGDVGAAPAERTHRTLDALEHAILVARVRRDGRGGSGGDFDLETEIPQGGADGAVDERGHGGDGDGVDDDAGWERDALDEAAVNEGVEGVVEFDLHRGADLGAAADAMRYEKVGEHLDADLDTPRRRGEE
jgi:hypothetical protein